MKQPGCSQMVCTTQMQEKLLQKLRHCKHDELISSGVLPAMSGLDQQNDEKLVTDADTRIMRGASLFDELALQMKEGEEDESEDQRTGQRFERGPSLLEDLRKMLNKEGEEEEDEVSEQAGIVDKLESDRRREAAVFSGLELGNYLEHEGLIGSRMGQKNMRDLEREEEEIESVIRTRASVSKLAYSTTSSLLVWTGTWNVANVSPPASVVSWLRGSAECGKRVQAEHSWVMVHGEDSPPSTGPRPAVREQEEIMPDIYAIALQEIDNSVGATLMLESKRGPQWEAVLRHSLAQLHPAEEGTKQSQYVSVCHRQLGGVLLSIFARRRLAEEMRELSFAYVSVGVLGVMGNKGAIGARLRVKDETLCFVGAHLAAGEGPAGYERRCQDIAEITQKMRFSQCFLKGVDRKKTAIRQFAPPLSLLQHDKIIWMGDLNFRLRVPKANGRAMVARAKEDVEELRRLWRSDELYRAMAAGTVLRGFDEGALNFLPTYKFDLNSDHYDSSHKARTPAWTDRILWKGSRVTLLSYTSSQAIRLSDHRPVSALISFGLEEAESGHSSVSSYKLREVLVNELVHWGEDSLQAVSGAVRSSADLSAEAVGTLFSTVGLSSLGGALGLAGLTSEPHGAKTGGVAVANFSEAVVTMDNYRELASCRLDAVLDAEQLRWVELTRRHEVGIEALLGLAEDKVLLRATTRVAGTLESVQDLLWDTSRRVEWDRTMVEGSTLFKYDDHHVVLRLARSVSSSRGEEGISLAPEVDLSVLMSRHALPALPGKEDGREREVVVLLQSIRHRLVPESSRYLRANMDWEAYLLSEGPGRGTQVTVYLNMSLNGIHRQGLQILGVEIVSSLSNLQSCLRE